MTSVRDHIRAIQRELLETADLTPSRATELLNRATSLLGNVNDELRLSDAEYKRVLLHCLRTAEKANRAKIEAETSPSYARRQEADDTKELTVEMIRSLKVYIRAKQDELRLAQ